MNGSSSECRPVCPSPISIHSVPRHPGWTLGFHAATEFGIQHSTAQEFISMVTLGMFLLLLRLAAFLLPSFQRSELNPTMKSLLLILHGKASTLLLPNRTKVLLGFPRPAVSCYMKSKQFQRKRLCLQRDWCKTTRRGKVFLEPKRTKKEPQSPNYCSLT